MEPTPARQDRPLALITGASAGIGATFARELARRGHDLILVARNAERLESLGAELSLEHGISTRVLPADLSTDQGVRTVESALSEGRGVDLLINNAGFGIGGPFASADIDAEERMVNVHVLATVRLTRAALPPMLARKRGAVINVSSLAAFAPGPRHATYGASKAYLNSFSEALALELAHTGVQIQVLCPGFTHTEFHDRAHLDKGALPRYLWMSAESVVVCSLRALERKKIVVVPGLRNRVVASVLPMIPRTVVRAFMGRAAIKYAQ